MATLNELGRNSASVTYGPSASGSDLFPTLQAVDTWFRNDTFQGVTVSAGVTAANAVVGNSSATSGTIWNTQARVGDYIMIAGQQKIISNVGGDQSITVTGSFSPAITLPSAVKAISSTQPVQTAGYITTTVRGDCNGTVYVTNGSSVITGVGTYFLTDATNSVTLTSNLTGTIAIATDGTITGTSTLFTSQQGSTNGLYPGDSIAVTTTSGAVYYFEIATVGGGVGSDTAATVTIPPTIAISGATLAKATNGSSGRYININGRVRSISSINSNTSMTVNFPMDFTDSNLRYKVYPRGTISNTTSAGGTVFQSTSVTAVGGVANATVDIAGTITGTNPFIPGSVVYAAAGITAGTTILNQVWATGPTVNNTSVAGTNGTNVLTTSGSQTGTIAVGQLVTGSGAIISGVPAGTYVVGITGTSPNFTLTLSQNLTGTVSGTVYFATPGGAGRYTFNQATTTAISAATVTVGSIQGTNTNFFWDLGYYNTNVATNTPYMIQTSLLDQVWVNDEVRTFNFNSFGGTITGIGNTLNAYLTDYSNTLNTLGTAVGVIRQPVYLASFKREDSYINGTLNRGTSTAVSTFASDLRIGDDIIIDGTECTVTQVLSDSQFKVNFDFTHSTAANSGAAATASPTYSSGGAPSATTFVVSSASNISVGQLVTGIGLRPETYVTAVSSTTVTVSNAFIIQASGTYNFYNGTVFYKKLKLHGYVLEGTREGGPLGTTGKWSQVTTLAGGTGTNYPIGTTSLTVTAGSTVVGPYQFVKISGGGGPPLVLAGQATASSTTVTGVGTSFTTQLHVGAEIILAGQYLTVTAITSDTALTVSQTVTVSVASPIYRSVPLYTYTTAGTTTITLATPLKNNLFVQAANPPQIAYPANGADFIEYVYSAPNYSAEQGSTTLLNTSPDRKYVGFRMWPLFQSTNVTPTATATIGTAFGAYATPVYERWTAGYAQTHGVGINLADLSGGTMIWGSITTTTLTLTQPVAGSLQVGMGIQGLSTGYPNIATTLGGTAGLAGSTYTVASGNPAAASPIVASLYGVSDITAMSQVTGGFLYLFGNKRYFAVQGRTSSNIQTQLQGCLEFERAQPEDVGTGTGTTSGITFGAAATNPYAGAQLSQGVFAPPNNTTPGFGQSVIQSIPGLAPWPCYGYFNGNRLPTGAQQIPTLPQAGVISYPVHGCVISVPRVRNSVSDLVGFNAHIYSALTITTGRWGHQVEFGSHAVYSNASVGATTTITSNALVLPINAVPQIHMGQIVPVYTNIYNARRFMFSPVVVLGPAYDPDVRGRLYGMKILPSGLGTLMDTVSITTDSNFFYNTSSPAADHWVTTTPPAITLTAANPGQIPVQTTRFTTTTNTGQITQSWRSLEDNTIQATGAVSLFVNNFRYAFPA